MSYSSEDPPVFPSSRRQFVSPLFPAEVEQTTKMPQSDNVKPAGDRSISSQATLKVPRLGGVVPAGEGSASSLDRLENREGVQLGNHNKAWKPGTLGFESSEDGSDFVTLATIPLIVLRTISRQQGSPQPVMKSEISEAAGSAAFVGVGNIGGSLLKYGGNLVIQRGFGAAAFGLYTLSMSVVNLVAAIFNLGLDDAMVRYVSIYRTKRQTGSLQGLSIFCTAIVGVTGILGALLVFFYAPFLAAIKHSPGLTPLLQIMAPMVPLLCMQTIWISGLQGFKEFRWRVLLQRVLMPLILIILLLGSLIFFYNLAAIFIVALINALIGAVLSLSFYFRKVSSIVTSGTEEYRLREWLSFAAPNLLTAVVDTVLESVDTLLLAYFAISNVALGQYAAAIKISGFILMPQVSFNAMFAPTIAELHAKGEQQKLAALFKIVTKWVITFSLPVFLIATLFSSSLLGISGGEFVSAWPLVIAFSVGNMVNISTGAVGYMLLMTGHSKISFLNSLAAVIVNIVLGIILTPRYGAMGVAIATGLAVCTVNLMKLLQVRFLVKMQPYRLDVLKPLGAGAISALLTGGLLYLLGIAHFSFQISRFHISFQLFLVPVFLVSYIGLLRLFKVSPEDKVVLDALRRKFRRGKKNKKR